jgi:autotransporter-associated beta strand protein
VIPRPPVGSGTATGRTFDNAVTIGGNIQIGGSSGGLSTSFIRFNGTTNLGGATREITAIATGLNSNFGTGAIFTGILSNGGITKAGSGTITLNNNGNTFTGATTVNAGNLAISQSALLNSSSVTLAASGAQLFLGENGAGTHTLNNLSGVAGSSIRTDFTLSGTNTNRSLTINQTVDGEFAGSFVQGGSRAFEHV